MRGECACEHANMRKIKRMLHGIDKLSEWSGRTVMYLPLIMASITLYDIGLRLFFNNPTDWAIELVGYLCCIFVLMSGAYALRYREHVNIDILYSRLSMRKRAVLDLVTSIFFFAFVIVLVWQMSELAWRSLVLGESTSSVWDPPFLPFKVWMPIGAFLLLLQGVAKFARDFCIAITGQEIR